MHNHQDSPVRRRHPLVSACGLLLALAGCGDGTTPPSPPPVPPALRIVAGEGQSDTVDAVLATRLDVVVTDDRGRPSAGVTVQFTSDLVAGSTSEPGVLLRVPATGFQRSVSAITDQGGTARAEVAMGQRAGPARVVVSAAGLADTADFTVRPGAVARLAATPRDTAVYVDGSFVLRVDAADRRGNAVPDPVTYTPSGPDVRAASGTVTGVAPGRTFVVLQAGAARDSIAVSVVPRGELVARRGGLANGLVAFGLDGSRFRVLTPNRALRPRFMPDGSILFVDWEFGDLHRITPDGTVQPLLQAGGGRISRVTWPHPSRDGGWIYFTQFDESSSLATPTRVRSDGTGLEPVPGMGPYPNRGSFSPSPDGTHLAYFAELEFDSRNVAVRVSRIGSDAVLAQTPGHMPEWSPTGEWIAYVLANGGDSGPLRLMRPDGTGVRAVGSASRGYWFGMDWSPDGRWIVAAAGSGLELVSVETGQVIPLPYAAGLLEPSWKP